jgi:hypothetical protein
LVWLPVSKMNRSFIFIISEHISYILPVICHVYIYVTQYYGQSIEFCFQPEFS